MHQQFEAIVVGGGILGWSTAYHLQTLGLQNIAVIDVTQPANATTGAGAGFVGTWAAGFGPASWGEEEFAIEEYSLAYYRALGQRQAIQLRTNGNLFVARTAHGYNTWIAPMLTHRLTPHGTQALSAGELVEMSHGALAQNEVYGAVYHPHGLQIHTTPTLNAMVHEATDAGVTRVIGELVTTVIVNDGRVTGVSTSTGTTYHAPRVVLACGAWSNQLIGQVSETLPLYRLVATRVISPSCDIPSSLPTLMIPEMGAWIREHQGGLMWGTGDGYAPLHNLSTEAQPGTRPHHPELLHQLTRTVGESLQRLFPHADISVAEWTQGMPVYTVDRRFCAGAVPHVAGLWAVTGDNEAGVTHAPGLGRMMADLVVTGHAPWVNHHAFALDRFSQHYTNEPAVAAAMPPRR
jgi:glycine/D-amino acid oxidase-like deaminating enzyme